MNHYQKSNKALLTTCTDNECIIENIDGCKNNPENSSTTKVSEPILSCFSIKISTKDTEVKNAWKSFCESLRKHAMKKNNYKKKKKLSY